MIDPRARPSSRPSNATRSSTSTLRRATSRRDIDARLPRPPVTDEEPERSPVCGIAIAMAFPAIAAAVMVGGVFIGVRGPRSTPPWPACSAWRWRMAAARIQRSPWRPTSIIVGGLFGIGLLMVVPERASAT